MPEPPIMNQLTFFLDAYARMPFVMKLKEEESRRCELEQNCGRSVPSKSHTLCVNGKADEYDCKNVNLLSLVSLEDLGSKGNGNDIWGWTDPETGREYAIVGCADGTSFVDVTEPTDPKVLGFLRTKTYPSTWRDIKVR